MALFRKHRGGLDDSMQTVREVNSISDIIDYLNEDKFFPPVTNLECRYYCYDDRIGWDTFIITHNGMAIGFTNGEV